MAGSAGLAAMGSIRAIKDLLSSGQDAYKYPVMFVGHGSPMNGIEDNVYSNEWKQLAKDLPAPKAVLCISAHWLTKGTAVTAMNQPETIHDFGGFPQALFDAQYPAPGSPEIAELTKNTIHSVNVGLDHEWGLDHGTWTILKHIYPEANIPVLQLSIDYTKPAQWHYDLAKELYSLREKGVLIIGSGNMVHNLRMVDFARINDDGFGYDWALEMNQIFKDKILSGAHSELIAYEKLHSAAKLAIPTPDHYWPLLYTLALQDKSDALSFFNDKAVAGSLTMTSLRIG